MDPVERLFSRAAIQPDSIAVRDGDSSCTYAEFCSLVCSFAEQIRQEAERRVLIACRQGTQAYAAMFATLLAGGFYSPVSVPLMRNRMRRVAESFKPTIVIGPEDLREIESLANSSFLHAGESHSEFHAAADEVRSELAYIMYTSGSTGEPKGVAISRRALEHYVDWLGAGMEITADDRMSQYPGLGFDLSVIDVYGALAYGAQLHSFSSDYDRLFPGRKIKAERITIWSSVPSVLELMMNSGQVSKENLESVRLFTFCGEPLRIDHLDAIFESCPDSIVFNTYGPTETTVAVTCRRLTANNYRSICEGTAPLGEPIGDMSIKLREFQGQLKEMVISGPQLAQGYWNDPEATAKVFRLVTADEHQGYEYSTGDIVEQKNGELYFRGRNDRMVKVRGHRVELDQIVVVLAKLGFSSCVGMEDNRIVAVIESDRVSSPDLLALRQRLASELEPWELPESIRVLNRLPRTKSDKIDIALALQTSKSSQAGNISSAGGAGKTR